MSLPGSEMQPEVKDRLCLDLGQAVLAVNQATTLGQTIRPRIGGARTLQHFGDLARPPAAADQRNFGFRG